MKYTATFRKHPPPRSPARGTSALTTMTACRSSGARGLTASLASGRRSESRGASWSRSSTQHPPFRFSTILSLCRRWWTQWWKSFASSSRVGRWLPSRLGTVRTSRLSKCPRFFSTRLRPAPLFLSRRRQNSWSQCLGSSSSSSDAPKAHSALESFALVDTRGLCVCVTLGGSHRQPRAVHQYWAQVTSLRACSDIFQQSSPNSGWCLLTVLRQGGGYRRYVTETGTHSVKLYVVVDTPVMAQMRIPMVLEILQLQYIDKMVDVCCAGPASSGSGREETVEIPQLQPVFWTWSFTRLLCATTDAHGRCPHAVHRHFSRPCDHAATLHRGSAPDSVIAGDSGHSSCATEKGTRFAAVLFMAA